MPIKSLPEKKLPASVEEEQHATEHESGGADEVTHNNLTITTTDHHDPASQNVDSVDGYDITKNGAGGTGIINFNT